MSQGKQHYFMISGSIMFTAGEPTEASVPSSVLANAIVRHDSMDFGVAKLGKAQQNLHKSFTMKLPEPELVHVHDIVIIAVSYLGWMTEEEFQAPPADPTPVAVAETNIDSILGA